MYNPYEVYKVFKTVEAEVKDKNLNILTEDKYDKMLSDKNKEVLIQAAGLFNTKFQNVKLDDYIRCGFSLYKSFGYDKFFRSKVIDKYIADDSRLKRDPEEGLNKVLDSMKHIGMPIKDYLKETVGTERRIIYDYIHNNIGSTVLVWCIWRNLLTPTDIEWEYLNTIKSNYPQFEKAVIKYAPIIDQWRIKTKAK